jgi:hypothetical protein
VVRRRDEENLGHEPFPLRAAVPDATSRNGCPRSRETIGESGAFLPASVYSSSRRPILISVGPGGRQRNAHISLEVASENADKSDTPAVFQQDRISPSAVAD